jgi:hypothetical protein
MPKFYCNECGEEIDEDCDICEDCALADDEADRDDDFEDE